MKEEAPQRRAFRGARPASPTRRLGWTARTRDRLRHASDRLLGADVVWSGAFVVVVMALLVAQHRGPVVAQLAPGQPAPENLRASFDVEIVDPDLTAERRRQARERIPDVYVYDTERRLRLARSLGQLFEEGRRAHEEASLAGGPAPAAVVRERLGARIESAALEALIARGFDPVVERELVALLHRTMGRPVVGNKEVLGREPAIVLLQLPERRAERVTSYERFADIATAREDLLREARTIDVLRRPGAAAVLEFAGSFVAANVHLDSVATEERREAAAGAVPPVLVRVAQGDLLIRKGELLTEEKLAQLRAALGRERPFLDLRELLALLFFSSVLAFFLFRYCAFHQRAFRKLRHLHALLVLMLLSMLLLGQALLWLASVVVDDLRAPFDQLGTYVYLVPLGAGAIVVTLLANGRIATAYAAFTAVLFGALHGWDFSFVLWALVVQLSGVYGISAYRERTEVLRAGLIVGGAGAVAALAVDTLRGDVEPLARSLYGAGLAFVGGAVGGGVLISFCLPLLERLFGVLTDVRLLELSNVSKPLLSELALKAPGSYNHSLVVGTLAEEGARAIGANALFCRVAAFYHDIGKMSHPEYFVENQRGVNPHDRLSPSMSALIIAAHVKDGIRMAREARLPSQIVDIIPQHHGTKLMTYFYEKARASADPALGPVKEADFRYPGPKPQSREAAVFMLADAVEAAARTVEEPTANRLREVIRKVTRSIVLDGQLDSCDMTFADLERVQAAFHKLLLSMYHQRVDYPGFEFGRPRPKPRAVQDGVERRAARSG